MPEFSKESQRIWNEQDPNGLDAKVPGAKLDAGKPEVWLGLFDYFPRALLGVAEVSTFGAIKYSWGGWKSVVNGFVRYTTAMLRHVFYEAMGEKYDKDSKILHAKHTAWNALARLELLMREEECK